MRTLGNDVNSSNSKCELRAIGDRERTGERLIFRWELLFTLFVYIHWHWLSLNLVSSLWIFPSDSNRNILSGAKRDRTHHSVATIQQIGNTLNLAANVLVCAEVQHNHTILKRESQLFSFNCQYRTRVSSWWQCIL